MNTGGKKYLFSRVIENNGSKQCLIILSFMAVWEITSLAGYKVMISKNKRGDGCHSWTAVMIIPGSNSSAYHILQDTKCRGHC